MRYFPECFYEVKYVTFLPEPTGQLLLYLWRVHINPLNAKLNPICHLLALLGAHHILHVSRVRVNSTNEAVITTCEESLRALFRQLRLAIRIKFGLQKFAATHVRGH